MSELTEQPPNEEIGKHLSAAMDHMARIISAGSNSRHYIESNLWVATRSAIQALAAMGLSPDEEFPSEGRPGERRVEWDIPTVWREIANRNQEGSALHQIWTALQNANETYIADDPFPTGFRP